jgi:hypothetical protein
MRCPDCNKFVSFDEPEIEAQEPDIDGSTLTGQVRIVLKCSDCGNELKDAELDYEIEIEHDCKKRKKKNPEYEVCGEPDCSGTDRYDGKPGTPMRYRRHYYGAEVVGTVTCVHCKQEVAFFGDVEERAAGFNDLV